MYCVLLNNLSEFQETTQIVSPPARSPWVLKESGSGLVCLHDQKGKSPVFFVSWDQNTKAKLNSALLWAYRELHPKAFICSGKATLIPSTEQRTSYVPKICLRSAGRVDIQGSPVLYEELFFNELIQQNLIHSLKKTSPKDILMEGRLFSSDFKVNYEPEDLEWLNKNLGVDSVDIFSGDVLLMGKRLNLPVGHLKINYTHPKELAQTWSDLNNLLQG